MLKTQKVLDASLKRLQKQPFDKTKWQECLMHYRVHLHYKYHGGKPKGRPDAPWKNAVLRTRQEYMNAVEQAKKLGLFLHIDLAKNWDSLAALDYILKNTNEQAQILDVGAEFYSVILPWLSLYDYQKLFVINPIFEKTLVSGPIFYEKGDICRTRFTDAAFDVITCLSVIEHGVDIRKYFAEVSRILKPGGMVITSCDYYFQHIDTHNQVAFGKPIHIFCEEEITSAFAIARTYGLELTDTISLTHLEKPIRWENDIEIPLEFTFLIFSLRKFCAE